MNNAHISQEEITELLFLLSKPARSAKDVRNTPNYTIEIDAATLNQVVALAARVGIEI